MALSVEALRQQHAGKRGVLAELDDNIAQMHRSLTRLDDKNASLKKQGVQRSQENEVSMRNFSRQLAEAEHARVEMASRSDRSEQDAVRIEQENETEALQQEKERELMEKDYRDMEASVIRHLKKLQASLEEASQSGAAQVPCV